MLRGIWTVFPDTYCGYELGRTQWNTNTHINTNTRSLFLFNQSLCLCKHSVYLSHTALFRDKNTANTSIHIPPARAFYGASVFHSFTRHKELAGCRAALANLFQPVLRYAICIGLHCIGAHNSLAKHLLVFFPRLDVHLSERAYKRDKATLHMSVLQQTSHCWFFFFLLYLHFLR